MKPIEILTIYINNLSKEHKTLSATEHSYRGYLKDLIEALDDNVIAINEPKRVKAGAPDYLIATKSDTIEMGHIEAKDINSKSHKEQFTRYKDDIVTIWLKDRKGRVMGEEDYEHYNKIIVSLVNTHRLMQAIDKV